MLRIKIKDLPKGKKITRKEMENIFGGKLTINQPNEPYEKEADQIADRVMSVVVKTK